MNPITETTSEAPSFVLVGSKGLWAADCLVPGCLWSTTAPTPETADRSATRHAWEVHGR
jgi:hypothetical protein